MSKLLVVKFLGPVPGAAVAAAPVGLLAWDDVGAIRVDWVPDEAAVQFWKGVVDRCRDAGTLIPPVVEDWGASLANGQTADLQMSEVIVPEGQAPQEVFGQLAGELTAEWAMLTTEMQDARDGAPSMLDLFRPKE